MDALSGDFLWPVDQVGAQALTVRFTGAPDVTGRTYACQIWTERTGDGGVEVGAVTVDHTTDGATGVLYLTIDAVTARTLKIGWWFELVELTPVERPLIRGRLATRRRVIT